jgi:hypothetical protein
MNTHTHTQGPWQIQFWNITNGDDSIGELFSLWDEYGEDREAERLANARLIAAAPEMLEALESLAIGLSPASVELQRETLADLCRVCREIAENALAKAKGGDA